MVDFKILISEIANIAIWILRRCCMIDLETLVALIANIVIWGIPLVGLVGGITNLLKWLEHPLLSEKVIQFIGGLLMGAGTLFFFMMEKILETYPDVGIYGPPILWSLTVFLIYMGFYPGIERIKKWIGRRV